jgi:hypothetical protein
MTATQTEFPFAGTRATRARRHVAAYRLTRDAMEAAADRIGCTLSVPFITRGWKWDEDDGSVLVVNNSTDSAWYQDTAMHVSAICLIHGRLHWKSTIQGQHAMYFGADVDAFAREFAEFGTVARYAQEVTQ